MREFKMGEAAALLGVSADTVRRLADARKLRSRRTRGGQRLVDGRSLASWVAKRRAAPLPAALSAQSIRNRLPGIVVRVVKDRVAAQVELQVGPHRLVSLLTREAVDALGLEPGVLAVACVKSTNLSLELPGPRRRGA
jgi:molybdopterin-binding protein